MRIYGIGGLGADHRVYDKLKFKYPFEFIEWIEPKQNEHLNEYCKRLSQTIDDSADIILVGVSFGGIIAQELSKYIKPKKTILISSAYSKDSIPLLFRILLKIRIHYLIPDKVITTPNALIRLAFGVKKKENKKLLNEIIRTTSPKILKWSLSKIGDLDSSNFNLDKVILIHGTSDRLLKFPMSLNVNTINNGGHFMIVENSDEINSILQKVT